MSQTIDTASLKSLAHKVDDTRPYVNSGVMQLPERQKSRESSN